MSVRTLTSKQLAADLQISTETLRRYVKQGACPAPIWLSPGCVRFLESDIVGWFAREKMAANHDLDSAAADIED